MFFGVVTAVFAPGCHRTNIYKIYEKRTIDTGVLLHISRILRHDFFNDYSHDLEHDATGIKKDE
jgi:hypothetical protein